MATVVDVAVITGLIVIAILLLVLSFAYNNYATAVKVFSVKTKTYEASYIDIATLVENLSEGTVLNHKEILIIKTILSIHSEALKVTNIQELFKELEALRQEK